ncbi:lipoate--protein ligase family protein [Paenibacillus sp. DMB20]|uniref:lipoate--protein ligase family protein n=1 Tax=Paenibacillus sp. DMB20 TaxID=1642570 RepID=UPI000A49E7C7
MTHTFQLPHETGPILLLDRTRDLTEPDVLYSFALDELLCRQTGRGGPAICHLWRHPRAFVMGVRDSRLPGAEAARQRLRALGYDTAVRHSGGAAVPLDPGVVNLSLILPLGPERKDLDFHPDFEAMVGLIRSALRDTGRTVDTGEIEGAFCPGTYDLSIDGQKFCGIAQRRQNKAFIVQAFIIAEGSGAERAALVRSFYDEAAPAPSRETIRMSGHLPRPASKNSPAFVRTAPPSSRNPSKTRSASFRLPPARPFWQRPHPGWSCPGRMPSVTWRTR